MKTKIINRKWIVKVGKIMKRSKNMMRSLILRICMTRRRKRRKKKGKIKSMDASIILENVIKDALIA